MNKSKYTSYLKSKGVANINHRIKWLKKAERLTGKSVEYILYDNNTLQDAKILIRNSETSKPNRIINRINEYKNMMERDNHE